MTNVLVIGVDGLNCAGKSTQLRLIREWLNIQGIPVVVMKGDGSRKGSGANDLDPVSQWWQENYPSIVAADLGSEEGRRAGRLAASRLNREIYLTREYFMPRHLEALGKEVGIILVDRTVISRLFVERRFNPDAGIDEVRYFDRERGERGEVVIPDIFFLLQAPREVLLARNATRTDNGGRQAFSRRIIDTYYDDFEAVIQNVPEELESHCIRVDAARPIDVVFAELASRIRALYNERREGVLGVISPEGREPQI